MRDALELATASATAVWKWPLIGQPGVVSETVTSTTPFGLGSIERTMSSSTIERCSSGSITTSSALSISSLSITAAHCGKPAPAVPGGSVGAGAGNPPDTAAGAEG